MSPPHPAIFIGRTREQAEISAALLDDNARTIIVSGPAGVGKSTLLLRVLEEPAAQGALIGIAKHFNHSNGSSLKPLIGALEDTVSQGLDLLYDPESAVIGLSSLLGASADALADLGEGVFRRLHRQNPNTLPLNADAAEARVQDAALRVLRWLEGFQKPIIILLDDWGRAEGAAREFYRRLSVSRALTLVRILASERLDEPMPDVNALRIPLRGFDDIELCALVDASLRAPTIDAGTIAATLREIGASEPLAIANHLHRLNYETDAHAGASDSFATSRAVAFLRSIAGHNVFDDDHLQSATSVAITRALALLEGSITQTELGALVPPANDFNDTIAQLERTGIVQQRDGRIDLSHDTVREAIFARMSASVRASTAASLSDAMRRAGVGPTTPRGLLMLGLRLLGGLETVEPALWAKQFYLGAAAARQSGDRERGHSFAAAALELSLKRGQVDHETLVEASLSAIDQGQFETAVGSIQLIETHARNEAERSRASELLVHAMRMNGDLAGALQAARTGMLQLGISPPQRAISINTLSAIARVLLASPDAARRGKALSGAELAREAPLMRAIHALAALLFERDPLLAVAFLARSISPRIAVGTAAGAAAYAVICANLGLYKRGAAWAKLSHTRQSDDQPLRAAAMLYASNTGDRLTRARAELNERRADLIKLAFEQGELSVALYAMRDRAMDALLGAASLRDVEALAGEGLIVSSAIADPGIRISLTRLRDAATRLKNTVPPPLGVSRYEPPPSPLAAQTERLVAIVDAVVDLACGDYAKIVSAFGANEKLFAGVLRQEQTSTWIFATSFALTQCEIAPPPAYLRALRTFARLNPANQLHRQLAITALTLSRRGRLHEALDLFERAAQCASASWLEAAIILRAAGETARRAQDQILCERFAARADDVFAKLGVNAPIQSRTATAVQADAEQRLKDADAALLAAERAATARARLLAAIGHELRTPLQGARAIIDLGQLDKPEAQAALATAIDHLALAIDELVNLALNDSESVPLRIEPFAPNDVLNDVAALWRASLRPPRQINVATTEAPLVAGDAKRIRQALNNLVSNAVKYGEGDVTLSATAHQVSPRQWRIDLLVDDEGTAMSNAEWTTLFEPFKRGDSSDEKDGLGLGLSISRRIAKTLGGELTAEPGKGGATRFRLSVSLPELDPLDSKIEQAGTRALSVLLVEDEALTRRAIHNGLAAKGANVVAIATAGEARALMSSLAFDAFVFDARLPDGEGIALAQVARRADPAAAVALLTGSTADDLVRYAAQINAIVLTKPVGLNELHAALIRQGPSRTPVRPPTRDEGIQEAKSLAAELVAQYECGALHNMRFLAHKLCGLGALFHFAELRDAARRLEHGAIATHDDILQLEEVVRSLDGHLVQ